MNYYSILKIMTFVVIINQVIASEDPELDAINNARKCSSTVECGPGYCCTVGNSRFSEPICKRLGTMHARCHKRNEGENKLLSWPNGISKLYKNIYVEICPCDRNLSCRQNQCGPSRKYTPSYITSNRV